MVDLLPCVELEPAVPATASVVWLHGLGADGHDFEPVVPHLGLPAQAPVRFVFPHAPKIPVTLNGGFVMPAWYDIRDVDLRHRHDEAGIRKSALEVEALIAREGERGVAPDRIVLAGFSQGGAIALHVGLRHPHRLAGLIALSTYLVCGDDLEREASTANRETPILQVHGTEDPMVTHDRGVAARDALTALGYQVEWHEYPMQHQVCLEELQDIGRFLTTALAL